MKILTAFVLLGVVDSFDEHFATVELNTNPATNGGPSMAVMPVSAFPCEIYEGKRFSVVKVSEFVDAVIICQEDAKSGRESERVD